MTLQKLKKEHRATGPHHRRITSPAWGRLGRPGNRLSSIQQAAGNHGVLRRRPRGEVPQAELEVGTPGDRYEREAERVAEQVMRMPEPNAPMERTRSPDAVLRRVRPAETTARMDAEVERPLDAVGSQGQPLVPSVRRFFESRFGHDFSDVRIHTESRAAEVARLYGARAFTVGRDVVFGSGQYQPQTGGGRHLLAHELTHVLQQRGSPRRFQRAAPAVAAGVLVVGGIALADILFWVAFVVSAIAAAYLLVQAYEYAESHGFGVAAALQAMMAAISEIVEGARRVVRAINDLLERATRIPNTPGCRRAIQELSVRIVQFELHLQDLVEELSAPAPRADRIRTAIEEMEGLLPEIALWARIVVRECFPGLRPVP